ncbi:hypothetical protein HY643_03950 [Candidatus Woesearchaeota archaeon]|nr:hypothetical protein [Candidatus Woesearchaeota archaeon]
MSLDNIFQKAEKPIEEKKLQVVASEDSIFDDWLACIDKLTIEDRQSLSGNQKDYFTKSQEFLKSYQIKPEMISKFNKKVNTKKLNRDEKSYFGVFLSTLIQTSYDQGWNNFEFENVNCNYFLSLLKGKKGKDISVKTRIIDGDGPLQAANYCSLETKEVDGNFALRHATNCSLKAESIIGNYVLWGAENCVAEITNYEGYRFGFDMKNCIIYSPNQPLLKAIKSQFEKPTTNKFFGRRT